jgi:uncharacterized protein
MGKGENSGSGNKGVANMAGASAGGGNAARANGRAQGAVVSTIDAFTFARLGKEASGSLPLVRFARAVDGLPPQPVGEAGEVRWSARGELGRQGEPLLHLHVQAHPVLVCQRCMGTFVHPIDAGVTLHLVKSEAELDEGMGDVDLDGDGDMADAGGVDRLDDVPEKVLGSHHFDLLEQVEDELVLNIPYVPRHSVCPGAPLKTSAGDPGPGTEAGKPPSPFAVLEKLKQKD